MFELSLQRSFSEISVPEVPYVTSSVATLLVENINSTSLLEIQDNNSVSGSAFMKLKLKDKSGWLPKYKTIIY